MLLSGPCSSVAAILTLALAATLPTHAFAQAAPDPSKVPQAAPLTAPVLPQAANPTRMDVPKATTSQEPNAVQPNLPGTWRGSPVVEQLVERRTPLTVRKEARRPVSRRRYARHGRIRPSYADRILDRPALAGVELVAPLPLPGEPPHIVVPAPAFPLESFAAAYTTPPPPIVCHPTRRDPYAPDPRLYKEAPVECEADNP